MSRKFKSFTLLVFLFFLLSGCGLKFAYNPKDSSNKPGREMRFTDQVKAKYFRSGGSFTLYFPYLDYGPKEIYLLPGEDCKFKKPRFDSASYHPHGECTMTLYRSSDNKALARYEGTWDGPVPSMGTLEILVPYKFFNKIVVTGYWKYSWTGRYSNETVTLHYRSGNIYSGEVEGSDFSNIQYSGTGSLTLASGPIFSGSWRRGIFESGSIEGIDDSVRQLTISSSKDNKSNKIFGVPAYIPTKGRFLLRDGRMFKGELSGLYPIAGTMTLQDGSTYKGKFSGYEFHGQGTMSYKNGDTYEGNWKNSKRHGYGEMNYSDGGSYSGYFVEDQRHGEGKLRIPNGQRFKVIMSQDEIVKMAAYTPTSSGGYNPDPSKDIMRGLGDLFNTGKKLNFVYQNSPVVKAVVDDAVDYVRAHNSSGGSSSGSSASQKESNGGGGYQKIVLVEDNATKKKWKVHCNDGSWYIVNYYKDKKKYYSMGNWSWFSDESSTIENAASYRCR